MSDGMTDAARLPDDLADLRAHIARLEDRATATDKKVDVLTTVVLGLSDTLRHQQAAAEHAHKQTAELLAAMRKLTATNEAISDFLLAKTPVAP